MLSKKYLDLQKHLFKWNLAVRESSVWCIFNNKFNCTILKWTLKKVFSCIHTYAVSSVAGVLKAVMEVLG